MGVGSYDVGPFLSAQEYWNALTDSNQEPRKTEHLDYMDFAELYGDYVASYEKGQPDSHLNYARFKQLL